MQEQADFVELCKIRHAAVEFGIFRWNLGTRLNDALIGGGGGLLSVTELMHLRWNWCWQSVFT